MFSTNTHSSKRLDAKRHYVSWHQVFRLPEGWGDRCLEIWSSDMWFLKIKFMKIMDSCLKWVHMARYEFILTFRDPSPHLCQKRHESCWKWDFEVGELFQNLGLSKSIFSRNQISQIKYFVHSEWAHIKLNGEESWFAGLRGTPFDFVMGWMLRFGQNGPPWGAHASGLD